MNLDNIKATEDEHHHNDITHKVNIDVLFLMTNMTLDVSMIG